MRTPAVTQIPDNPEIAFIEKTAAFHFLAAPEAAYMTGQVLVIDGGLTAGWKQYDLVPPANVVDGRWRDDPA